MKLSALPLLQNRHRLATVLMLLGATLTLGFSCGKLDVRRPSVQQQPDLLIPLADGLDQPLGLSGDGQEIEFAGTALVFQPTAPAAKIATVSDASTRRRQAENIAAGEVVAARKQVASLGAELLTLETEKVDLGKREDEPRKQLWIERNLYLYEQIEALSVEQVITAQERDEALLVYDKYCEALVWDLVINSKVFLNNRFTEMPTPLIFCTKTLVEKGILYQQDSAAKLVSKPGEPALVLPPVLEECRSPQNGELKDFYFCLVWHGMARTSYFSNLMTPEMQERVRNLIQGRIPAGLSYNSNLLDEYADVIGLSPGPDTFRRVLASGLGIRFFEATSSAQRIYKVDDENYCCAFLAVGKGRPDGLEGALPSDVVSDVPANTNAGLALFPRMISQPDSFTEAQLTRLKGLVEFLQLIAMRNQGFSPADKVMFFAQSELGRIPVGAPGSVREQDFFKNAEDSEKKAALIMPALFEQSAELKRVINLISEKGQALRDQEDRVSSTKSGMTILIDEIVALPRDPEISAAFFSNATMKLRRDAEKLELRFQFSTKAPIIRACLALEGQIPCEARPGDESLEFSKAEFLVNYNAALGRLSLRLNDGLLDFRNDFGFDREERTPQAEFFNHLEDEMLSGLQLEMEFFVSQMENMSVITGGIFVLDGDFRRLEGGIALSDYNQRVF